MAREISSTSIVSDNHFFCAAASTWHSRGNSIFAVWCKSLPCRGGVSVADGGVTDPSTPLRLRNASLRVAQDDSGRSFPPHPSRLCLATFPFKGKAWGRSHCPPFLCRIARAENNPLFTNSRAPINRISIIWVMLKI